MILVKIKWRDSRMYMTQCFADDEFAVCDRDWET